MRKTLLIVLILAIAVPCYGQWISGGGGGSTGAGSGDVTKVGTPAQYYLGIWTGDGTLGSVAALGSAGNVLISGGAGANPSFLAGLVLAGGANTFSITNGTASLDVAAGATLNIDKSLQVATGAVVINGNSGGSSVLTLPNQTVVIGTLTNTYLCKYTTAGTVISCDVDPATLGGGDITTDGNWVAAGDLIVGTGENTAAILSKGTANQLLGMKSDASTLEWKSTISLQIDDSAAQFKSATASKGVRKLAQTGIANTKTLTDAPTVADDTTFSPTISNTVYNMGTLNFLTTGYIQGGINISSDADGMDAAAMTAAGMYGTLFIATGAGTWILPRAVLGMSACLMDSGTAHDLILDVTAGSTIRLKGAEGSDGVGITNASGSTTGDFICVVAVATDKWSTMGMQGTWVSQ